MAVGIVTASLMAFVLWRGLQRFLLRRRLAQGMANPPPRWQMPVTAVLLALAILCLSLALQASRHPARPQIIFMLDCSASMNAMGSKGSRLDEAKTAIAAIARQGDGAELALISFAGTPFLDYPPSLDRQAFFQALQTAAPGAVHAPGSCPELALRDAQALANQDALLVMASDFEMAVSPHSAEIWRQRRLPLLAICCGCPNEARTIPFGESVLTDPATGKTAYTTPSPQSAQKAAATSTAPWSMAWATETMRPPALLPTAEKQVRRLMLAAFFLLLAVLWMEPLARRLWYAGVLCLCALPLNAAEPTVQQQLQELRQRPEHASRASELHRLSKLSALLCKQAAQDESQAGLLLTEAIAACHDALRLSPGNEAISQNLELALRLAENLNATTQAKGNTQPSDTAKGDSQQQPTTNIPLPPSESQNTTAPTPSALPSQPGTWREMQNAHAERHRLPTPPGIPPW